MKKLAVAAFAALAAPGLPAQAADLVAKAPPMVAPPPASAWDMAFGAALGSDYIFRGITQSAHKPSVSGYVEPRFNIDPNLQLYAGLAGNSIKFPNAAAAEIDLYAGVRPTIGPLSLDFGVWYYWYPGGESTYSTTNFGLVNAIANASFVEGYAKASYAVNDILTLGANVYYTPSYLNTGADGTYYSATMRLAAPANLLPPGIGGYISAEVGRQELGATDADGFVFLAPVDLKSYTTWNVGLGWTYKVFTVDLRYYDTDLAKTDCNVITGDPRASVLGESNWCGARFVARLSADLTLGGSLK